jgi:formate dehydrogenase iron-sulfur subunit
MTGLSPPATAIRSPLLQVATTPERSGLLEALLREQGTLTAVERFAQHHQACATPAAGTYRDLLPLSRPGPGQQYAFEVDLDACTGCKACVAACHSLNGLDETEVWRTVGLLHGGTPEAPAQQTVTTSCHHCIDPACLNGCPVAAYEKDPVTGIVRHLDDQCIGCQYCTLMCPYDAPKYSPARGIVRKCDMCSDRLASDEAPACVQGCPNEAIRIRVVDQVIALQRSRDDAFLPGAPAPDHTVPTTHYRTTRPVPPAMLPADFYAVSPEHGHPPLVLVLVLTQLAVGTFVAAVLAGALRGMPASWTSTQAFLALAVGMVAMAVSPFHLGRPQHAWRFFLGLRTSWLSREILALSLFAGAVGAYALSLLPALAGRLPGGRLLVMARPLWAVAAVGAGLGLVACSAMVYAATRRVHWRLTATGPRFFGTTVVLGAAAAAAISAVTGAPGVVRGLAAVVLVTAAAKLVTEATVLRHLRGHAHTVGKRVASLMVGDLRGPTVARFLCGALGGLLLPAVVLAGAPMAALPALGLVLAGEILERYLFFKAAPPSRMPGGLP